MRTFFDRAAAAVSRRLGAFLDVAPYDFVQLDTQKNLHKYIRREPGDIRRLIMVGAHMAYEVDDLLERYRQLRPVLFEASPRYSAALQHRFAGNDRVQVFGCAAGRSNGKIPFFETNLAGSGSLLPVGSLGRSSYGMAQAESYEVDCYRLDDHARQNGYHRDEIDCLWIDAQGAELDVLSGAPETLERTRSLFVEISVFQPLYERGATLDAIMRVVAPLRFVPVSLGTDPLNGTGNALFVKSP